MVLSTAFPSFTFGVACLAAFCSAYSLCGCTLPSGRHLQGASRQEQEGGWVMGVHQAAGRLMKHFKCYTTGDLWGRIPSMLLVHLTATVVIVKVPLARCGNGWQQAPYLPQSGKGLLFSCRQKSPEGHGGGWRSREVLMATGVLKAVLFPHENYRIGSRSETTSKSVTGICCSGSVFDSSQQK